MYTTANICEKKTGKLGEAQNDYYVTRLVSGQSWEGSGKPGEGTKPPGCHPLQEEGAYTADDPPGYEGRTGCG